MARPAETKKIALKSRANPTSKKSHPSPLSALLPCGCRCPGNLIIRSHVSDNCVNRLLNVVEKRLRIDANPQRQEHQGSHVSPFANVQIQQLLVFWVINVSKEHPLIQP